MKSISASIVIVAGLATLVASTLIGHSDTEVFVGAVALVTIIGGGIGWVRTLTEPDRSQGESM
jgi:hypothetical protein